MKIPYKKYILFSDKKYFLDFFEHDLICAMPSKYCPALGIKEFNEELIVCRDYEEEVRIELSDFFILRQEANYKTEDIEKEAKEIYPNKVIEYYENIKNSDEWKNLISKKLQKEKSKIYKDIRKIYNDYLLSLEIRKDFIYL